MPVARFELPDGRIARFEVPEGTTPEQAQKLIEAQLPSLMAAPAATSEAASAAEAMPAERRTYAATEVPLAAAKNLPASAKQFATGLYEAVTQPVQTAKAVMDVGAGALRAVMPESVRAFIDRFDVNPAATQQAMDMANAVGGMYKDRYGSYENLKRTLAEDPVGAAADLSTLLTGGAGVARTGAGISQRALGAGAGVAQRMQAPAVANALAATGANVGAQASQIANALTAAATATNPLSAVTVPAQAALGGVRQVFPSSLTAKQQQNLPRDMTLAAGQAEGYVVPPGSVDPVSGRFVIAERIAGKTMLEQMMSAKNQETTNRLARRAVGMPEDAPITSEALQKIRTDEFAKGYAPIKQVGNIGVDNNYVNDLVNIEQKFQGAAGSFPAAVPDTVSKLVNAHLVQNFDAGDAVQAVQRLRNSASASFRKNEPEIGHAQRAIADALENQIERGITASGAPNAAQMLDNFRAARQRMAISHTIEDAVREGSGNVNAQQIARQVQAGRYLSGDLKTIGEFANVFPRVTQMPQQFGTPSSGAMLGTTGAVGAALGALAGGAPGAAIGSQAGAVAPSMISGGMRRYLMSGMAQRAAQPRYDPLAERLISDIAARNALLTQQAGQMVPVDNALAR